MTNYNFIAPVYDVFKRIVFRNDLTKASTYYLPNIANKKSILIVGGGTGKLLEEFSTEQHVDFLDPSRAMIRKAQKRKVDCRVNYINSSFQGFNPEKIYDVIVFPFVLDLFSEQQLQEILSQSNQLLKENGFYLISDFYPEENLNKHWQILLLRTVIVFFRITTRHQLNKIVNIAKPIQSIGYKKVKSQEFFHGMVFASIWKKITH